jgi:D-3-phosphoglycerate dehydrogenase / 2-oxoglutarate reductase
MDKSTAPRFKVLALNAISQAGLKRLPGDHYEMTKDASKADAILVRSADLHNVEIAASVLAIGRAGAGTNNIPVKLMNQRGVPVFNAPGANANAVKELVIAGMLMAARNLAPALRFVAALDPASSDMDKQVEDGKKSYAGFELQGHTLGVIGLGKIGCLIADAAIKMGMHVIGFDPEITIDAAWSLPAQVKRAQSVEEIIKHAHFVTVHVPLLPATKGLIHSGNLALAKTGAVLLNFSREGIVDDAATISALDGGKLRWYVCDFPSPALNHHPRVIALPHLGASTAEAEDNCAAMVADQLKDYLEHGNIANAVNFPNASAPRESNFRVVIANANVPNMLGQISSAMAAAKLNIDTMVNKSRGEMAYTIVDVSTDVPEATLTAIRAIEGVLSVRYLPRV